MTLDALCWIASMTKAITAAAAMQLVERPSHSRRRSGRGVSGVFLSQVLPFYDRTALELFETFETEVYRAL
jgi:hypothetical protein